MVHQSGPLPGYAYRTLCAPLGGSPSLSLCSCDRTTGYRPALTCSPQGRNTQHEEKHEVKLSGRHLPQSEITNRQGAKNAKAEIAHWGETNETFNRPMSAFSGSSLEGSEHRIFGDLGVMAVQIFLGSGLEVAPVESERRGLHLWYESLYLWSRVTGIVGRGRLASSNPTTHARS
jgi:hypothetical protein